MRGLASEGQAYVLRLDPLDRILRPPSRSYREEEGGSVAELPQVRENLGDDGASLFPEERGSLERLERLGVQLDLLWLAQHQLAAKRFDRNELVIEDPEAMHRRQRHPEAERDHAELHVSQG